MRKDNDLMEEALIAQKALEKRNNIIFKPRHKKYKKSIITAQGATNTYHLAINKRGVN